MVELGHRCRVWWGRVALVLTCAVGCESSTSTHPPETASLVVAGQPGAAGEAADPAAEPVTPACTVPRGHARHCDECGPCGIAAGHCASDADCAGNLMCARGVGAAYGFAANINVCVRPGCEWPPGYREFCADCGPCPQGLGHCQTDAECAPGLRCARGRSAEFGLKPGVAVCVSTECAVARGSADYCRTCGPCGAGQGDCDSDDECAPSLTCRNDAGSRYGLGPTVDVCDAPSAGEAIAQAQQAGNQRAPVAAGTQRCRVPRGHSNYCEMCGPCPVGVGDCDSADQCEQSLTCAQNVGARYGYEPDVDICVLPAPSRGGGNSAL